MQFYIVLIIPSLYQKMIGIIDFDLNFLVIFLFVALYWYTMCLFRYHGYPSVILALHLCDIFLGKTRRILNTNRYLILEEMNPSLP